MHSFNDQIVDEKIKTVSSRNKKKEHEIRSLPPHVTSLRTHNHKYSKLTKKKLRKNNKKLNIQ